jgi:S-formylglutathione hydrolase FrmB
VNVKKIAAALFAIGTLPVTAEIKSGTFSSPSLGKDVAYVIDLPASYATGDKKYPVIYALHGLFESSAFYERRGLAAAFAAAREKGDLPDALVVTADGSNSFYVNGAGGAFEDMVAKDLVDHVEKTYRTLPGRDGRVLFGVSMGGYGALRLGLKYPDRYAAVATHSAMVLEKIPTAEDGARRGQMAAFNRIFGDPIDAALWAANDPLQLAAKVDPKTTPMLYFDCGTEDRYGLFVGNKDLHDKLLSRGIKHEFGLYPGDHGYEYVKTVIDKSLRFLGAALKAGPAKPAAPPSKK